MAAVADPLTGVAVYDTVRPDEGWILAGGTSASPPIVAGINALAGAPAAGDYAAFYPYRHFIGRGAGVVPPEQVLSDVTSGSNGDCGAPMRDAGACWDGPTGVGTPLGSGAFATPFAFGASVVPNAASTIHNIANFTLTGNDGTPPYTWSASGLPLGLSLDPSTGTTAGQPTAIGASA